jgi:hypothetical protein
MILPAYFIADIIPYKKRNFTDTAGKNVHFPWRTFNEKTPQCRALCAKNTNVNVFESVRGQADLEVNLRDLQQAH